MSTLTGKTVADTYINLLQLNSNNQGVDSTLRNIETGDGTATPLNISTDAVSVAGNILPTDTNTYELGSVNSGFNKLWIGTLSLDVTDVQELHEVKSGKYALASQGVTADNAIQRDENIAWSTIISTPTTLAGYGITDAATSIQGAKADTALQPGSVNFVSDVNGNPTTLAGYGITDAATFDQGVRADSALQPGEAATTQQGARADTATQRGADESLGTLTLTGNLLGPAVLTIDPATHGDISGKVVILGDLQVDGTTTTINSVTVSTTDKQIILSQGAADAASSNGSGIVVEGSDASLLYISTTDTWQFNKPVSSLIAEEAITIGSSTTYRAMDITTENPFGGFEGVVSLQPRDVPGTQTGEIAEHLTYFRSKYDLDGSSNVVGTTRHVVAFEDSVSIGTTTPHSYKLYIEGDTYNNGSSIYDTTPNADTLLSFRYNGVQVGSIARTPSSTSYLTTSDYRLKSNLTPLTSAIDRINNLPVYQFNFVTDTDVTIDGFLAHEVQEVVPEAVFGEKDGVDDQGNPEYQGIDQSKLVPLLVAAVKEQQQVIDDLLNRINALESN